MRTLKALSPKGLLQGDMVVWMIFLTLCMLSIVEVYSASSTMSYRTGQFWRPVLQHATYVVTGVLIAWLLHRVPCNYFKMAGVFGLPFALVALFIALFAGHTANSASRWLEVGGLTVQPSEFAKPLLVACSAFFLSSLRDERGAAPGGTYTVLFVLFLTLGLIVTENASTAVLIFLAICGLLFVAQARVRVLAWLMALAAGSVALWLAFAYSVSDDTLAKCSGHGWPIKRVPTWVARTVDKSEPPADPRLYDITERVQETHASIAIATSHVVGKGPGNSVQRDYLPQAYSDFIYAIIIEELGLAGAAGVMFLYLLLMWRAMRIASRCKHLFPAYLTMGLALMMVLQAMVNMAVATGALPVTGQPLPLVSRGGTSMFVNCAYIGAILSASRAAKREPKGKETAPREAAA